METFHIKWNLTHAIPCTSSIHGKWAQATKGVNQNLNEYQNGRTIDIKTKHFTTHSDNSKKDFSTAFQSNFLFNGKNILFPKFIKTFCAISNSSIELKKELEEEKFTKRNKQTNQQTTEPNNNIKKRWKRKFIKHLFHCM